MRSMLFSAKAEYACIAMLELAARHGDPQPVRLKAIADAHDIPQRFLVQILLQLKGAGLVHSTRGAAGGYLLARAPDKISLAQVIGVIDRDDRAEARPSDKTTPSALKQAVRGVWKEVANAQHRILAETSLSELVRRSQADHDFSYTI
jgi:Rrf2 family protein